MYSTQQIIDKKENAEELEELDKIAKYKKYLADNNYAFNDEIQQFIVQTVNKYRIKMEVKNFYMSKDGNDHLSNQINTLNTLEAMISQYMFIKSAKKNKVITNE